LEICWRLAPLADAKYERSVEWMSTTIQPTIVSEWRARKTPCPLQLLLEVYRMPEDGDFHIIRLIRFLGREMKQKEIMFTLVQSEPLKQALEHALECAPRGRVLGNSLPTGMVVNVNPKGDHRANQNGTHPEHHARHWSPAPSGAGRDNSDISQPTAHATAASRGIGTTPR